jgi:hypothetical protein
MLASVCSPHLPGRSPDGCPRQGRWRPLRHYGQDFDDRSEDIAIIRRTELFDWFGGQATWTVELQLPREPTAASPLRVRVAPRAQFQGFTVLIP